MYENLKKHFIHKSGKSLTYRLYSWNKMTVPLDPDQKLHFLELENDLEEEV